MESKVNGKKINIVKIRQEDTGEASDRLVDLSKPQTFEPMPQLYLELLENKEKIRQNLVNQEYDPDDAMSDISYFQGAHDPSASSNFRSFEPRAPPTPLPRPATIREEDDELMSGDDTDGPDDVSDEGSRAYDHDTDGGYKDEEETPETRAAPPTTPLTPRPPPVPPGRPGPPGHEERDRMSEISSRDDDEDDGLSSTYSDLSSSGSVPAPRSAYPSGSGTVLTPAVQPPQQAVPPIYDKMLEPAPTKNDAPRLADLKRTGEYVANPSNKGHVPDLHRIYSRSAEEEEEIKRELLFKFEILKKSYRTLDIPNFTIHTDLKTLTRAYENTLRRVSLDSNVDSYKQYLIGGFMLVEFVVSNWLSFDMQGFTQQQILNMNQYERLLIELGEKSYVPGGKAWPVEIRLLGMILMNAVIFIISKIIMKKTGSNLISMMNSFGGNKPVVTKPVGNGTTDAHGKPMASSTDPKPGTPGANGIGTSFRRRMRGPNIDPDDIPDLGTTPFGHAVTA